MEKLHNLHIISKIVVTKLLRTILRICEFDLNPQFSTIFHIQTFLYQK